MPVQHSSPGHPMGATHRTARPCRQDTAARHRRARERGCSRKRRRPGVRLHTWGWRPLRARRSRARDQAGRPHRASTCTATLQLPAWKSRHSSTRRGTGPIRGHLWISSGARGRTEPLVPAQGSPLGSGTGPLGAQGSPCCQGDKYATGAKDTPPGDE